MSGWLEEGSLTTVITSKEVGLPSEKSRGKFETITSCLEFLSSLLFSMSGCGGLTLVTAKFFTGIQEHWAEE